MTKLQSEAKGLKGAIVTALLSASYAHMQVRTCQADDHTSMDVHTGVLLLLCSRTNR
jgi:hypothetical protein